jgi:methionyl aminopeptidase
VSTDQHRQVLTGVLFSYDGETLTLVATDTHRLAVRRIQQAGLGSNVNAIVPEKALRAIKALPIQDDADVTIRFSEDRLSVEANGAKVVSQLLNGTYPNWERVVPGVTTNALDKLAYDYIVDVQGGIPAPLNYTGGGKIPYPKSICTSVNHQVCHGIPNDKPLKKGDVVNIDVTVIKDSWHGDTSRMFFVGEASIAAKRLAAITYEAMWHGIKMVRPGIHLGDIGHAIQRFAEGHGFSVVREFCGHGIGQVFHEEPQVLHYGRPGTLEKLVEGMTFTIEPMINAGRKEIKEGPEKDGWTIVTADPVTVGAMGAHRAGHPRRVRGVDAVGGQPGYSRFCERSVRLRPSRTTPLT